MKLNKLVSLKFDNKGKLTGGFASLNASQMSKINGGKKQPLDTNGYCSNTIDCTSGGQNDQCTNVKSC